MSTNHGLPEGSRSMVLNTILRLLTIVSKELKVMSEPVSDLITSLLKNHLYLP